MNSRLIIAAALASMAIMFVSSNAVSEQLDDATVAEILARAIRNEQVSNKDEGMVALAPEQQIMRGQSMEARQYFLYGLGAAADIYEIPGVDDMPDHATAAPFLLGPGIYVHLTLGGIAMTALFKAAKTGIELINVTLDMWERIKANYDYFGPVIDPFGAGLRVRPYFFSCWFVSIYPTKNNIAVRLFCPQ